MDDLLTLPGVAQDRQRRAGCAYHIADGVVVDTHVKRLSNRLGLTAESTPKRSSAT